MPQSGVKFAAVEVSRKLRLGAFAQALTLLEAYQLLRAHGVVLGQLSEFWDASSKVLLEFCEALDVFLAEHQLLMSSILFSVPLKKVQAFLVADQYLILDAACAQMKRHVVQGQRVALVVDRIAVQLPMLASFLQGHGLLDFEDYHFKVFVQKLLMLKVDADLQALNFVFTSLHVEGDFEARQYLGAKLFSQLHAFVDLKTYVGCLKQFSYWQSFVDVDVSIDLSLLDWLNVLERFLILMRVRVPVGFVQSLRAYFLPAHAYVSALKYTEFLQMFDLFVMDTCVRTKFGFFLLELKELSFIQVDEYWYLKSDESSGSVNAFVPMKLQKEFGMIWDAGTLFELNIFEPELVAPPEKSSLVYHGGHHSEVLKSRDDLGVHEQVGGAALLNEQVACAFKAFGHFQLRARMMVNDEAWLSAKFKGIATHQALERVWQVLQDQRNLLNYSDDDLRDLVDRELGFVLQDLGRNVMFFLPQALAQLELVRLRHLILSWLVLEKKRPYFKVLAMEQLVVAHLGSLVIKLRLDRVDELEDGQRLVLDYKTGAVNVKDWFSELMTDMQLPLYLLTQKASGAALAQVNLQPKFSGVVRDDMELFSELKHLSSFSSQSWDEVLLGWQEKIHNLVYEITQGVAKVDPLPGACDYCDLQALCRIKEKAQVIYD